MKGYTYTFQRGATLLCKFTLSNLLYVMDSTLTAQSVTYGLSVTAQFCQSE